jgi:hypothetical protein
MRLLHRAVNLMVALTLVAIGATHSILTPGMTVAAAVVGAAGLYWLWDEYINMGQQSED